MTVFLLFMSGYFIGVASVLLPLMFGKGKG
jgi:hypothetical protein